MKSLQPSGHSLSFIELVVMLASTTSLAAFAIDAMLPALPSIGHTYSISNSNQLQWIITLFVMGSGAGQLFYGPLADRYGRRRVLLLALMFYSVVSLLASFATSLTWLLIARVTQGVAISATSVVTRSVVRDLYAGNTMAKVMSLIFLVFLTTPILAPSIGQVLLLVTTWRGLFQVLALLGVLVTVWIFMRLPETLTPDKRRPLSAAHLSEAAYYVLSHPTSMLYTLAGTLMYGSLIAFISTMPQIFANGFHAPQWMPLIFACCAGTMAVATFLNSKIVEHVGVHRIAHFALFFFIGITALHSVLAYNGQESMLTFAICQALTMGAFGLSMSNFGAIAMQPMGAMAGSAASIQGVLSTIGGGLVGALIGHQWSSSILFLPLGSLICGAIALGCVLTAERMQLFVKRH
jgi:DHA1 family bicyclomycin/chloramphenicol resistance-like MFS transporter